MNTIPTLDDILDDHAPYPYTLSAFMGFLSDNHCLEILEFIFETRRYRRNYHAQSLDDTQRQALHRQWLRLLQTHIVPEAPREINITDAVREKLLDSVSGLNSQTQETGEDDGMLCPDPGHLDPAEKQMHELLHDSILLCFVKSCSGPEHMQPSAISDNERGTRSCTPEILSDDTDSERRRRAAAEICPFPSPAPSDEESKRIPLQHRRSRSWSLSQRQSKLRQFNPRPLSQPSSRTKLHLPESSVSTPRSRTVKLDDIPPSITFYDERSNTPTRRKHGSISSSATGTRSLYTSPEETKETADLVRTRTSPANVPDVDEPLQQRQGQRRRWHRLPTTSGIFRHFKKVSN